MSETTIEVGRDFSPTPGGRYVANGASSGEEFRERLLAPALRNNDKVVVFLDGTAGYAGSFLEEAFGGLVRACRFSLDELHAKLFIRIKNHQYEIYRRMAEQYIAEAAGGSNRVA
ncbi:MAG: STAS-like domain-containing protein [Rhizomicrobium sp.]